ncbi:MAG: exodeoxyribonuclease VII small subunit [Bacilli bacterium]|nr:exodeoxyribonuclease VII small subunit [Bacilli bacterium]
MKEESFENSLIKLENIVKELESGETPLDNAILKYTEAMKLAKFCSEKISKATESVNKILKDDGTVEEFNADNGNN